MDDQLRDFIQAHRSEFDTEVPSLKVWHNVDKNLKASSKPISRWRIFQIAASLALLITTSVLIGMNLVNQQPVMVMEDGTTLNDLESFYGDRIENKMLELASYKESTSVMTDLQGLDQVFDEVKSELLNTNNEAEREKLVYYLIENYKLKLKVLEKVLDKINTDDKNLQNLPKINDNEIF
jgi:hypothetical protein